MTHPLADTSFGKVPKASKFESPKRDSLPFRLLFASQILTSVAILDISLVLFQAWQQCSLDLLSGCICYYIFLIWQVNAQVKKA